MRLAHISLYPPRGEKHVDGSGVVSYTKNLVTSLAAGDQNEQFVLCQRIDGQEAAYEEDGVAVRRCFDRGNMFVAQLHRELKKINPDVIHIQQELALYGGPLSAYLLHFLVRRWSSRTVVTLHGVVNPSSITPAFVRQNNSSLPVPLVQFAFRRIYTPLAEAANRIIVHEDLFKDTLVNGYQIPADKISVIPHGVEDLKTIDEVQARKKLGIPKNAHAVLFMGYATGYKGIDLLLEGFAEYAHADSRAYLLIGAGKHPKLAQDTAYLKEYERLQHKAAALIPAKQYRWAGFIGEHDIAAYYSAADVSLYPYTIAMSSSGPMSFAMSFQKPFLASDAFQDILGAFPKVLFDRTAANLAERLAYFFTHKDEYSDLSQAFKTTRSWTQVSASTSAVYQQLIEPQENYDAAENQKEQENTVIG